MSCCGGGVWRTHSLTTAPSTPRPGGGAGHGASCSSALASQPILRVQRTVTALPLVTPQCTAENTPLHAAPRHNA